MANKEFVNGIRVYRPNANAPDFVLGQFQVNTPELQEFLQKFPEGFRFDLKRSRDGNYYLEVNNWRPKGGAAQQKDD